MAAKPSESLKTLSIIHLALVGGILAFGIFKFINNGTFVANADPKDVFIYVIPVVAAFGYFMSQFMFKKQLLAIDRTDTLTLKLAKYQAASIVKYAFIEGPAFLAIIAYGFNGNALFLVIAIFLVVYLFMQKPNQKKFMEDVPLTIEDKKEFKNTNR